MLKQSVELTGAQKRPQNIEEPRPAATHVKCAICCIQFVDYYQHIFSEQHKKAVAAEQNAKLFDLIDEVIGELDGKRMSVE